VPAQSAAPTVAPAPVQQPAPQVPVVPQDAGVLPVDTRDRTREQFEKLVESNKRLLQENEFIRHESEQQRELSRIFNPIAQFPQPGAPSQVNPNDFIDRDPNTGEKLINDEKLKARIEDIGQRASKAEKALEAYMRASEEREIDRQNQEAYRAYPELSPDPAKRDEAFHRLVRGVLADSMVNSDSYGGRPMTFKEAADFVSTQTRKPAPVAPNPADEAEKKAQTDAAKQAKEQSSAQAQSQPRAQQQMTDDEELASLRYRTRYLNDDAALAERIKHTEHIKSPDAKEV
jgi:hypothetical protein